MREVYHKKEKNVNQTERCMQIDQCELLTRKHVSSPDLLLKLPGYQLLVHIIKSRMSQNEFINDERQTSKGVATDRHNFSNAFLA